MTWAAGALQDSLCAGSWNPKGREECRDEDPLNASWKLKNLPVGSIKKRGDTWPSQGVSQNYVTVGCITRETRLKCNYY